MNLLASPVTISVFTVGVTLFLIFIYRVLSRGSSKTNPIRSFRKFPLGRYFAAFGHPQEFPCGLLEISVWKAKSLPRKKTALLVRADEIIRLKEYPKFSGNPGILVITKSAIPGKRMVTLLYNPECQEHIVDIVTSSQEVLRLLEGRKI